MISDVANAAASIVAGSEVYSCALEGCAKKFRHPPTDDCADPIYGTHCRHLMHAGWRPARCRVYLLRPTKSRRAKLLQTVGCWVCPTHAYEGRRRAARKGSSRS